VKRLIVAGLLALALPAMAEDKPNGRMQACTKQWLERRDAGQVEPYKPFLKQCLTQLMPVATKASAVARGTVKKPRGPNRMKICAAQWRAMKAEGKTGGQSYRDFSRQCLKG
jgi:hypothetical protein